MGGSCALLANAAWSSCKVLQRIRVRSLRAASRHVDLNDKEINQQGTTKYRNCIFAASRKGKIP